MLHQLKAAFPLFLAPAAQSRADDGIDFMTYVDGMKAAFGRMIMCHMMSDSTNELLSMADKIGVARKWIQKAGTHQEHFDICLSKRALAVANGAVEITQGELVAKMREKRPAGPKDFQTFSRKWLTAHSHFGRLRVNATAIASTT